MADSTRPKKKRKTPSTVGERRCRVVVGSAIRRWRKVKAANGYRSDAEMARALLDMMNPAAASSSAANKKMKCSQLEVQTLIEQEVRAAVQGRESNLKGLIETIQQLDCAEDYESSIQQLEARISRLTRKAEAAIAFMTKEQTKSPLPSLVKIQTNRADSEDEAMEVTPQPSEKSKCRKLFQIMENTKKALNKMQVDNEALKGAVADSSEEQPPPVLSPYGSPNCKENVMAVTKESGIKHEIQSVETKQEEPLKCEEPKQGEEPEQGEGPLKCEEPGQVEGPLKCEEPRQEEDPGQGEEPGQGEGPLKCEEPDQREEPGQGERPLKCEEPEQGEEPGQGEEPKASSVKVEFLPLREGCSLECKVSEKVSEVSEKGHKLLYPPLPSINFPSSLKIKAASYNIPHRLQVHLALIRNPAGLSVLWNVDDEDPFGPPMDSYSVFMTVEKVKDSNVFPEWIRADVEAKPLPMCMMFSKYKPGRKVCVAVVGKDAFGRYGPYSKVVTAFLPD
uniref:probable serine/threonine-protein kinase kinX n=1 Tax=Gasterosteus aculeatus aculeatus TaxID=481459 RepID=UPI001A9863B1|nr:probable serine/threonine-protein kinase kinX [Gasterosteus aculeatus aculeatus]XP_040046957.1 probable serine/threonine-protein kinase kinX [Gasterosteus aculeatus aculeatus]XP_040046958.1 probable serine/threonine-protein kinase kinX [Gasterosteus aculeatus aculeatus]